MINELRLLLTRISYVFHFINFQAIQDLNIQLTNRRDDCFLPLPAQSLLRKLEDDGLVKKDEIMAIASDFYATAIAYLEVQNYLLFPM